MYFEDLFRAPSTELGLIDFFEMGSNLPKGLQYGV